MSVSYCFRHNRLVFRLLMGYDYSVDCCFHDVMVCYLIILVFCCSLAVSSNGFDGRWPLRGFHTTRFLFKPLGFPGSIFLNSCGRTCDSLLAIWMVLVTICQGICFFFSHPYVRGCVSPSVMRETRVRFPAGEKCIKRKLFSRE